MSAKVTLDRPKRAAKAGKHAAPMRGAAKRVLVVTNDAGDAKALKNILGKARDGPFDVTSARRLSTGLKRLRVGDIDAIIVDLSLPDSSGIATFDRLFAAVPHTPIMTLSSVEDDALAEEAVRRGAQGYLAKGHFESSLVPQALRNVILRKTVEEAFYREKVRAEIVLNSIGDAVISTDISGRIDYLNAAAERLTGWSKEEAQGQAFPVVFRIVNGVTREPDPNPIDLVLEQDKPAKLNANTVLIRRDKSEASIEDTAAPIHDWSGHVAGAVIVFHDVSHAHALTLKMAHLAQHDFLTDLPNRVLLNDRIAQAIRSAKRRGRLLAVLFLDLDTFKHINDSLGHEVGDKLLQSVTLRLNGCVRNSDTVSRQGGDEFVILLTESGTDRDIALAAGKIITALAPPHSVVENELNITTSIGISVYPADGENAETLIKNADTAMYHAKDKGKNNYQFFNKEMDVRAIDRQLIEFHLRSAIKNGEFSLYYQPIVDLESGAVDGAEALLRWNHADWGTVLPQRFVPIAEDTGLIVPIGRWVLREACAQAKRWIDAGLPPVPIAVNISALEFRQPKFFDGVRVILHETGLKAEHLQLEITESVLMHDAECNAKILRKLKEIGIKLAMDDFGTGYSSLSYLKQFPIDILKIDQSFVHDITSVTDEGIIVSAVIGMGNSLKKRVIAEGIETQEQLQFLTARHCAEGQGYLFSRPVAAEQFAALLTTGDVGGGRVRLDVRPRA